MNPTPSDSGTYTYDIKIKDPLTSTEVANSVKIIVGNSQPPFLDPVPANKEIQAYQISHMNYVGEDLNQNLFTT